MVACLLLEQFKFERLARFFDPSNRLGQCRLPLCWSTGLSHDGDLESFLFSCPSLHSQRQKQQIVIQEYCASNPLLSDLIQKCISEDKIQFFMDCSVMSGVIAEVQISGQKVLYQLLKLTRNYIFALYKARDDLLKCSLS